jgi:hypothetical protein
MIFERLAHDLEHIAGKLRQLVEKEQTVVRQRDLAWTGHDSAADQAGIGDGVMRRAKRPLRDQTGRRIEHAGDRVDLGRLQSLFKR